MGRYVVAITGASGSIYGLRLLEELLTAGHDLHLIVSEAGEDVLRYEAADKWRELEQRFEKSPNLQRHSVNDLFAPVASGSYPVDGMVVAPCTMATLAEIANGMARNLITRAADVCLKERRRLILVPREMPLSAIHLENMAKADRAGAVILPAMPSFYGRPQTLDDLVNTVAGRILDTLELPNSLYPRWKA